MNLDSITANLQKMAKTLSIFFKIIYNNISSAQNTTEIIDNSGHTHLVHLLSKFNKFEWLNIENELKRKWHTKVYTRRRHSVTNLRKCWRQSLQTKQRQALLFKHSFFFILFLFTLTLLSVFEIVIFDIRLIPIQSKWYTMKRVIYFLYENKKKIKKKIK